MLLGRVFFLWFCYWAFTVWKPVTWDFNMSTGFHEIFHMVPPMFLIFFVWREWDATNLQSLFLCMANQCQTAGLYMIFTKWHLFEIIPFAPWFIQITERKKPSSRIVAKAEAHGSWGQAGAPAPDMDKLWEEGDINTSTQALNMSLPEPKESLPVRKRMHSLCLAVEMHLWLAFSLRRKHSKNGKDHKNCFKIILFFLISSFLFSVTLETSKTHHFLI